MIKKPTYEELEQRVNELERETENRKRVEEALRESEDKHRSMMEAMIDPVYICSPDFRVAYMNPAMIQRTGRDATGEPCYKAINALEEKCPWCVLKKIQNEGEHIETEITSPKDGRHYHACHSPIFHGDGSVSKMTIYSDITRRKQAEDSLQKAHEELERRVKERTAELIESNEQLKREIEESKLTEERLKGSEASLAEAQSIAHLGNWEWNIVTNELQWSDEIYRIFRLNSQELGATYKVFLNSVHPDDREFVKKAVYEALYEDKPYSIDHRIVLPDGTERTVHERAGITFDNDGKPIRMIGTVQDITERKRAEEELQRLSYQLLSAHEKERKRIALELHDSIGQNLSAIKYLVENAFQEIRDEKAKNGARLLESIVPVVKEAVEEVRRIQKNLRPPILDHLGILPTITWFCREFKKTYPGIRIKKEIDIQEDDVPDSLKIIIFRILQEAFNNIAKHSQTKLVRLSLKDSDGKIDFSINDDGAGFDVDNVLSGKQSERGLGLISMKERAAFSGGSLSIESYKGLGTTVRASWPIS